MATTMKMDQVFGLDGKNYYYIHRHIAHFEKDEAVAAFGQQKQEDYIKMKNRYKENYLASLQGVNPKAMEKLNLALSEDEVMSNLDEAILNVLNDEVSKSIEEFEIDKMLKSAYASLDNYLNTQDLKELDALFAQITDAAELLRSNITEITAAIGQKAWVGGGRDLSKVKMVLDQQIALFNGKNVRVAKKDMQSVLQSLKLLVNGLDSKAVKKSALQGYLKNIFSTKVGERAVSKGVMKALQHFSQTIDETLAGADNIQVTNDLRQALADYGQNKTTRFKTDNSFKGLSLELEDGESFKIDLGISTKWYKNVKQTDKSKVAITTENNFIHRVNQLLAGDQGRYYAYNALALVNQDGTAYAALKAAIVARTLDYLISGFGAQGDFSQFIVINGKFYSIWQIVLAVQNFNNGQGSSDMNPGKTDPITISASGLSKIAKQTDDARKYTPNEVEAYKRAKAQNVALNNLRLTGHFYPSRLHNALKKS